MSTGLTKRSRSSLALPPGQFARAWDRIRQSDVLAPEPQEIRVELEDAFKE